MKKFTGVFAALLALVGCAPEGASDVADEAPTSSSQAVLVVSDLRAVVAGPASGGTGSSATYTVTVSNLQSVAVNGVAASVALPAGAVLLSLGPGCTVGATPAAVRCSFGVLGGLASASRTVSVMLPFTPGAAVVSARAVFAGSDSNPANDLGSLPVTVFSAPLPSIPVAPPQRFLVTNCFGISSYAQCTPPPQNRGVFTFDAGGVIPLGPRTDMDSQGKPRRPQRRAASERPLAGRAARHARRTLHRPWEHGRLRRSHRRRRGLRRGVVGAAAGGSLRGGGDAGGGGRRELGVRPRRAGGRGASAGGRARPRRRGLPREGPRRPSRPPRALTDRAPQSTGPGQRREDRVHVFV